jgi:hypothetical protein
MKNMAHLRSGPWSAGAGSDMAGNDACRRSCKITAELRPDLQTSCESSVVTAAVRAWIPTLPNEA